jgi:methylmalonyl-CoA mutase cobalamin-binding subunit
LFFSAASFLKATFPGLLALGVKKIYGPGTDTRVVCEDIRAALAETAPEP